MKKILLVLADSGLGGITVSAENLANELVMRGNSVDILNMSTDDVRIKEKLDHNIKIMHLGKEQQKWNLTINSFKESKSPLKMAHTLFWGIVKKFTNRSDKWLKFVFRKKFSDIEYDVAIAFRQCAPCYYFVLNGVKAKKKIGFVHGELRYMGDISSWQRYMPRFDKIAYVSNAVRKEFIAAYPELEKNACTIYNMLAANKILKMSEEDAGICFDPSRINIVTVSRIENTQKQIHFIPSVVDKLQRAGINQLRWYIIGDGADLEKVKEQTRQLGVDRYIEFVGAKSNPYCLWKNADIFVLPTATEAYGMVVMESLILHVPVVVCRYPALNEIFEDGVYGYVAEQSIDSLAEKVEYLIHNQGAYQRIKANCETYKFTNDIAYKQFLMAVQDEQCEKANYGGC